MMLNFVQWVLKCELGTKARDLIRRMDPKPMAIGSIGQVHRAELEKGEVVAVNVAPCNACGAAGRGALSPGGCTLRTHERVDEVSELDGQGVLMSCSGSSSDVLFVNDLSILDEVSRGSQKRK